jgi:hypothetical protein
MPNNRIYPQATAARAEICKTFIAGSIPAVASDPKKSRD